MSDAPERDASMSEADKNRYQFYKDGLLAAANLRLLFNTTAELEEFLQIGSIRTNGIMRYCNTPQRQRAAFRDLDDEARIYTHGDFSLSWLLPQYRAAWDFFKAKLSRRDPEKTARLLLDLEFGKLNEKGVPPSIAAIHRDIVAGELELGLILLFLVRALPGFKDKSGDVTNIDEQYEKVINFLSAYTMDGDICQGELPVITLAREERRRTRLTLIRHTLGILVTHAKFTSLPNIARSTASLIQTLVPLQLEGLWTAPDVPGVFWKIENTAELGTYFCTRYRRDGARLLFATRFTVSFFKLYDDLIMVYVQAPKYMTRLVKGQKITDDCHVWYNSPVPDTDAPDRLELSPRIVSTDWPRQYTLQRVMDAAKAEALRNELSLSTIINDEDNYDFERTIYAITPDAVYVLDPEQWCFYRLPRHTEASFETLTIDSHVGIITISGRRYLGLDEHNVYIPLTPAATRNAHFARYGITITRDIIPND